jgi:hypothetical protein
MKTIRIAPAAAALALSVAVLSACGGGSSSPAAATDAVANTQVAPADATAAQVEQVQTITGRWKPVVSDTWEWQLTGKIDTAYNVRIYDIDLFDVDKATIARLKSAGRRVVCYFSAGSAENWRPDYARFKSADKGNPLDGWPGETWVDTRSANVRNIMKARLDLAKSKGCDGVEPDNVDAYTNDPGFPLTGATQLNYNRFLAGQAHARILAVALKNDVEQLSQLEPSFDFAINEQCHQFEECNGYTVFTSNNKPVLNAEYASRYRRPAARQALCAAARTQHLRTLVLAKSLDDSYRFSCD